MCDCMLQSGSVCMYSKYVCMCMHVLMRDEKERRKKQARSNSTSTTVQRIFIAHSL